MYEDDTLEEVRRAVNQLESRKKKGCGWDDV